MQRYSILGVVFLLNIVNSVDYGVIMSRLELVKSLISKNSSVNCRGTGDSRFLSHYWEQLNRNEPIIVHCMVFKGNMLGTSLGSYFYSLSCALASGAHFLGVNQRLVSIPSRSSTFFDQLPQIFVNIFPNISSTALQNTKKICRCGSRQCWGAEHVWASQISLIKRIMTRGFESFLNQSHQPLTMSVNPMTDIFAQETINKRGNSLPLFPDVAVYYRMANDMPHSGAGLMFFRPILAKIPMYSKFVYIFSEPHSQLTGQIREIAHKVLQALSLEVSKICPNATVIIKRDTDMVLTLTQLYKANITYCSPSTFCLWPSLARNGITYMPATYYIGANESYSSSRPASRGDGGDIGAGGSPIASLQLDLGVQFRWDHDVRFYHQHSRSTPLADLLSLLMIDVKNLSTSDRQLLTKYSSSITSHVQRPNGEAKRGFVHLIRQPVGEIPPAPFDKVEGAHQATGLALSKTTHEINRVSAVKKEIKSFNESRKNTTITKFVNLEDLMVQLFDLGQM